MQTNIANNPFTNFGLKRVEPKKSATYLTALRYLRECKFSVIPVGKDKKPLIRWLDYQKRLPTEAELQGWFEQWPDANIGIVTGAISNLAVIDLDDLEIAKEALESLIPDSLTFPVSKTPSGGEHWWFFCADPTLANNAKVIPGADLRANGGYIVAPPSINAEGKTWSWLPAIDCFSVKLPPLPDAYLQAIQKKAVIGEKSESVRGLLAEGATEGSRNDSLAKTAGVFLAKGLSFEQTLQNCLAWNRLNTPPLGVGEVSATVESIYKIHSKESRAIDNIEVVNLDSVTAETVSWLWQGYIPLGKLTLIDGDPGLGKSLFSLDLASRLTTGQPMPDGSPSRQGGVVLMSLEDGLADTIVPRLNVAGADKKKIIALQGVRDKDGKYRFPTVEDAAGIAEACKRIEAKLLVIDPLMAYMGKADSWKDQSVRRALSPLSKMADETGVSIIIIRHLNKSNSSNSIHRGGGSIGIGGAARSALLVAKDPEDENRRILAGIKANLAPLPPSLSYTIEDVCGIPKILWGGVTSHTADALLAIPTNPEERSALEDAKIFLEEVLIDGAVDSREIQRQAKQAAIAEKTLHRAKKALRVTSKKADFKKGWLWAMPPEDGQESPKVVKQNNDHLREVLTTFADSKPPEGVIDLTNVAETPCSGCMLTPAMRGSCEVVKPCPDFDVKGH